MAEMTENSHKMYYSISEVAQMLGVAPSLLRYWETEMPQLKPKKTVGAGVRKYTEAEIEEIKTVYHLVKERGFKISAAKKMLSANRKGVDKSQEVISALKDIRAELYSLKKQLEYIQ